MEISICLILIAVVGIWRPLLSRGINYSHYFEPVVFRELARARRADQAGTVLDVQRRCDRNATDDGGSNCFVLKLSTFWIVASVHAACQKLELHLHKLTQLLHRNQKRTGSSLADIAYY